MGYIVTIIVIYLIYRYFKWQNTLHEDPSKKGEYIDWEEVKEDE